MAELAALREELECRAMQLDQEAALSPYTDHGGEDSQNRLAAEANRLREQARQIRAEYRGLVEELLRDDDDGSILAGFPRLPDMG